MADLQDLMSGTIGLFWTGISTVGQIDEGVGGHVHRTADGELVIDLVAPRDRFSVEGTTIPHSIAATTTAGGALFLDLKGARYSTTKGPPSVPTRQYRADAVLLGVPIHRLRSDDLVDVTAFFPGISGWAGLSGSEVSYERKEDGRLASWSVELRAAEPQSQPLPNGQKLTLTTHWTVQGPDDDRRISSPVSFTISSTRPAHWTALVRPLLSVQGLVSMAFDGLVLADGGRATAHMEGSDQLHEGLRWWTARLMHRPPGARPPKSMNEIPAFYLNTIGGMPGVRRWIALARAYPRATGPLVGRHRFGTVNVETQLLEIAAAIEYWVALHRRKTKWANSTTKQGAHPLALARRVGEPFSTFVGDPDAWAGRFWSIYNQLKHVPDLRYDPHEVSLLAQTGAVLLQCALLNRVARSTFPAQAICDSHRYYVTGEKTRALFDS